jgi:Protein of unknown function (DUF2798)
MVNCKHQHLVFSFFMALFMSGIMSLVITAFNVGYIENIILIWLKAWSISFAVSLPTIIAISPIVKRIVNLVIKRTPLCYE